MWSHAVLYLHSYLSAFSPIHLFPVLLLLFTLVMGLSNSGGIVVSKVAFNLFRWCQLKILMDVSALKQGRFVIGEMVIVFFLKIHHVKQFMCQLFNLFFLHTGRGVDLNRNWSVDWGKKEMVCLSGLSSCTRKT